MYETGNFQDIPSLDKRTGKDLNTQIHKKAVSYTPEWRFREEAADAGTALALIYGEMQAETIKRFNMVLEKNRIAFFNRLQTKLRPSAPAEGYVAFGLVNEEVPGEEVPEGTKLNAQNDAGERVVFETTEDVFVTPAQVSGIFAVDAGRDAIYLLYRRTRENIHPSGMTLFGRGGKNLQKHTMTFGHTSVFQIVHEAWISLTFTFPEGEENAAEYGRLLMDKENVIFSYYTQEGYQPFAERKFENGSLLLHKGENQPPFAPMGTGQHGGCIRMEMKDGTAFSERPFYSLKIRSSQEIPPELVYGGGIEQNSSRALPFGERPTPYEEFYIGSNEVFSKRGAFVHISFDVDFLAVALETEEEELPIEWKMIMKRSDIKVDKEYDISIDSVIWEYFNGDGFKRLFVNEQYGGLFFPEEGAMKKKVSLRFICPRDMAPFMVNADSVCCIRARILKMNNFYKMKGRYLTPRIEGIKLRCDYNRDDIVPEWLVVEGNLERRLHTGSQLAAAQEPVRAANVRTEPGACMYFCFTRPLQERPIRVFFSMEHNIRRQCPEFKLEYLTRSGWKVLPYLDETEGFRKSGILTIMGQKDFERARLFGMEGYFIRFLREEEGAISSHREQEPFAREIHMNAVGIRGTEAMEDEYFRISYGTEDFQIRLSRGQIYRLEVWAEEKKNILQEELDRLMGENRVEFEKDDSGENVSIWIKWEEASSNSQAARRERCYLADYIEGTVTFPFLQKTGRIFPADEMTVRVRYRVNGNEEGNLPPGSVRSMDSSIGYISHVTNFEAVTGGARQETLKEALDRAASGLKNGGRAVTSGDFEDLAKEASVNIQRVKCFSNCNENGAREYGAITLVVLQKDFLQGRQYFDRLRRKILNYLQPRMDAYLWESGKFQVAEPCFVELNTMIRIQPEPDSRVFQLRSSIEEKITEFVDPVYGNFNHKGFAIGEYPNEAQLRNVIRQIQGVREIEELRITFSQMYRNRKTEVDLEKLEQRSYLVALNGQHEIVIQQ